MRDRSRRWRRLHRLGLFAKRGLCRPGLFRIDFQWRDCSRDGAVHAKNGEPRRVAVDRRSEFNGAIVVGDGAVQIALACLASRGSRRPGLFGQSSMARL